MRTIYRHKIPVDDQSHVIEAHGGISGTGVISFEGPNAYYEIWAEHDPDFNREIALQVYGTGHEIPESAVYLSTSLRHVSGLVFHLYEIT
jgi:hypothetical protein